MKLIKAIKEHLYELFWFENTTDKRRIWDYKPKKYKE